MLVGVLYLKRSYKPVMVVSVITVTVGIFLATYASKPATGRAPSASASDEDTGLSDFVVWCIGIGMLMFALVTSAFMGAMQEQTYQQLQLKKSDVPWQVTC